MGNVFNHNSGSILEEAGITDEKEKQRIKNGGLAYLMGGAEK